MDNRFLSNTMVEADGSELAGKAVYSPNETLNFAENVIRHSKVPEPVVRG